MKQVIKTYIDKKLVGELRIENLDVECSYVAYLNIHDDHMRQGYGKALMEQAILITRLNGATMISLHVDVDSRKAVQFYKDLGFTVVYNTKATKRIKEHHLMVKKLCEN